MALTAAFPSYAAVDSMPINDGWRFRQGRADIWYPASVPGTVHTDLIANDIIDDPYFRLNERGVQWVDMIPLDNFLPSITRERYEKHVLDAKAVNMNMIRV